MTALERMYFGNSPEAWAVALATAVASALILLLVRKLLVRRLGSIAQKTSTKIDDFFVELIAQTRTITLFTLSAYLGAETLTLSPGAERVVQKIVILILLLQGIVWGTRSIQYWVDEVLQRRTADDASSAGSVTVIAFMIRLALWTTGILLALDNLGFSITTLVAGLGIGGVAIALAVQSILGDIFASLSIVLDKPFVIGDFIVVGDHLGTIEYIGMKTTRIRSLSGEQVIFSNSELLKSRIHNFKRMTERRIAFTFGVTYDTPIDKLKSIPPTVRDIITSRKQTRVDRVHFKEFGESALVFEIVYFVLSPDYNLYMDIQQAINYEILQNFKDRGIEFAFPTVTVVGAPGTS